jgi:hypothetical protein
MVLKAKRKFSRRRFRIMQARMKQPAMIIPGAMEALKSLAKAAERSGVPEDTGSSSPASESDQWLQRMR